MQESRIKEDFKFLQASPAGEIEGTSNLIGLVLCGGESKRMGSDKGLLVKDGVHWCSIVSRQVEKLGIPVYASINSSQLNSYLSIFNQERCITDSVDTKGPLTGLISAWKAFPGKDILLVACDMLELKNEILLQLVKEYSKNRDFDFFAFDNAGITEPLCAVYTSKALLSILTEQNRLCRNGSLRKILDSGNTKKLIASHNCSFKNYNTKSDSEI